MPATSDVWMEVGDEIIDPSLVYGPEVSDEEVGIGKAGLEEDDVGGRRDMKNF